MCVYGHTTKVILVSTNLFANYSCFHLLPASPTQVNAVSLLGHTHEEALQVLQGVLDRMTMLVCHGYDPSQVPSEGENILFSWGEETESEGASTTGGQIYGSSL